EPAYGYEWQAPTMAFDPVSRQLVISGYTHDYKQETWLWNGSDWTQAAAQGFANAGITLLRDGKGLLTVAPSADLVGGRYVMQTWAWTGSTWTPVDTPFTPSIGGIGSSAYDPGRNQLVVLGGDTWTWDGLRWSRQHPALVPPTT